MASPMWILLFWISMSGIGAEILTQSDDEQPKNYKGHSVVRVLPLVDDHLNLLRKLQLQHGTQMEFWRHPAAIEQHVDMRLSPDVASSVLDTLNHSGLDYSTVSEDVQSLIDAERSKRSIPDQTTPENFNLTEYHQYEEITDWLVSVGEGCGKECEVFSLGESSEGRPMMAIRIGKDNDRKPVVWIDAGIHAREWIAPATALYIISKLLDSTDRVSRYLVNRYTWYILPLANPDGYQYSWTTDRLWRKTRSQHPSHACRGVDGNRNWDFHWAGEGTSSDPCSELFHGLAPFSEPETQNIASFLLEQQSRLAIYLSLHSYGQYWLTPWGYTYHLPDDYRDMIGLGIKATDAIRRNYGIHYQVGASSRLLYLAAGGSDDWAKGVLGVKYAYTVELKDTGRHGFILPPSFIESTANEMMQAARTLAVGVIRERRRTARARRKRRLSS